MSEVEAHPLFTRGIAVTRALRDQLAANGYAVLPNVLTESCLDQLRSACERYLTIERQEMDTEGQATSRLSHRQRRYFVKNRHQDTPFLRKFLFSEPLYRLAQAILGDAVYLFMELFVVKPARVGLPFSWHQDSGYMLGRPHRPYLTCWFALDDAHVDNGALWVQPVAEPQTQAVFAHVRDPETQDLVGYSGPEPGVMVPVAAGSLVMFYSTVLHRTGPNRTDRDRRVYIAEYSAEPIYDANGAPWSLTIPVRPGAPSHAPLEDAP